MLAGKNYTGRRRAIAFWQTTITVKILECRNAHFRHHLLMHKHALLNDQCQWNDASQMAVEKPLACCSNSAVEAVQAMMWNRPESETHKWNISALILTKKKKKCHSALAVKTLTRNALRGVSLHRIMSQTCWSNSHSFINSGMESYSFLLCSSHGYCPPARLDKCRRQSDSRQGPF